ncbi:uncharacterized protein EI90DRAFT_1984685 [Cantharellus anzutake]|uniref:uncharacterized protein n=1 Tax=Cantharellus anzutake TaxID=1750568 RepID=UPI001904B4E6|nr:uncharacterized protein EI90DRAFT_1984685 [Cantharellus anzutake]KAF8326024.1 hypothetical protein EI90DRAFT_1984685 [Cantharellus anzutake]
MPDPMLLHRTIGTRFPEILHVESFIAGGRTGLFVTFSSIASRNEFIHFTRAVANPNDPLYSIRRMDRSVDVHSLLKWYHIPLSLGKILMAYGALELTGTPTFVPNRSVALDKSPTNLASSATQSSLSNRQSTTNNVSAQQPSSFLAPSRSVAPTTLIKPASHGPLPQVIGASSTQSQELAQNGQVGTRPTYPSLQARRSSDISQSSNWTLPNGGIESTSSGSTHRSEGADSLRKKSETQSQSSLAAENTSSHHVLPQAPAPTVMGKGVSTSTPSAVVLSKTLSLPTSGSGLISVSEVFRSRTEDIRQPGSSSILAFVVNWSQMGRMWWRPRLSFKKSNRLWLRPTSNFPISMQKFWTSRSRLLSGR